MPKPFDELTFSDDWMFQRRATYFSSVKMTLSKMKEKNISDCPAILSKTFALKMRP